MTPAPSKTEEARDQEAVGRSVLFFLSHPRHIIGFLLFLLTALGGGWAWRENTRPGSEAALLGTMRAMRKDVVTIKVQTSAILQTLPETQRRKAQQIIDLQMAAVQMTEERQP